MSLRRAYWHLTGEYTDRTIQKVLTFEHPAYSCQRRLLRAYLMCKELTLEQVGQKMHEPVEVVQIYGELFFNVRDRMHERVYVAHLAFPDTWIKQVCTQSITDVPADRLLLQLALHHGVGQVDYFAGISPKSPGPETLEGMVQEFTNNILKHAYLMTLAGFHHSQPGMPVIDMAVRIINARRKAWRSPGEVLTSWRRLMGHLWAKALSRRWREWPGLPGSKRLHKHQPGR